MPRVAARALLFSADTFTLGASLNLVGFAFGCGSLGLCGLGLLDRDIPLLQQCLQRRHQVDYLAPALFGEPLGYLLAFELALSSLQHSLPVIIVVLGWVELCLRQVGDQSLGKIQFGGLGLGIESSIR